MYCQEVPEPWFEEVGEGKLVGGWAEVKLDPDFAAMVRPDGYHVFLTEYGDLGGLYVVNRGSGGFEVRSRTATASGSFGNRVMARRLDQVGKRMEQVDARPVPAADFRIPEVQVPKAPGLAGTA